MKKRMCILLACSLALGASFSAFGSVDYENADVIKAVQEALNEEGFDCGTPDGIAGNGTKAAISNYRSENNLPAGDAIDDNLLSSLGYIDEDDDMTVNFTPVTSEQREIMQSAAISIAVALYPILNDIGVDADNSVITDYGNAQVFGDMVFVNLKVSTESDKALIAECVYDETASYPWKILYIYDYENGHYYYVGADSGDHIYDYKSGLLKERSKSSSDSAAPVQQTSVDVDFHSSVKNDVTGRWRLAIVDTDAPINSFVVDYYKNYFKSDDEIHGIINKHDGTTSCVSVMLGMFSITVHKYVAGEENDANLLFSGDVISDEFYSTETGEIVDF